MKKSIALILFLGFSFGCCFQTELFAKDAAVISDIGTFICDTLNANVDKIADKDLRDKLKSGYVVANASFTGSAEGIDFKFDFPTGITMKDGELQMDEKLLAAPEQINTIDLVNHSSIDQTISTDLSESTSDTNSLNITAGITETLQAGAGGIKCGLEIEQSIAYGHEWTKEKSWSASLAMTVPAKMKGKASLFVKKGKFDIPYTYNLVLSGNVEFDLIPAPKPEWGIVVYQDRNFNKTNKGKSTSGRSHSFLFKDEDKKGNWHFSIPNLKEANTKLNDRISSVELIGNVTATLYQHYDYNKDKKGARELTLDESMEFIGNKLNNRVSSMKVSLKGGEKYKKVKLEKLLNPSYFRVHTEGTWSGVNCQRAYGQVEDAVPLIEAVKVAKSSSGAPDNALKPKMALQSKPGSTGLKPGQQFPLKQSTKK
ncbi:MAG: ETX/MTX2 family pore-forming toxin [Candidatus Riflebacteria bacterium]|nr:ETX/MTX2 family pore-forming toxin [Candidatus Riflebacteria bacterium]